MSVIIGTSGNNNLNGGSGDDVMDGGAGNDTMSGGSGSDIMDGGSGNDRLNGGSGNDTLIYTLGENSGATDVYTGGSGIDTVRLQLTSAEWLRADVQTQIALYLQHLNMVKTNQNTGEVSNGSASDFTFVFDGGTRLTVQMMERLDVWVGGHQFDFHAPFVTAADDAGAVTEDTDNPTLSDTGAINFVDVDWTQSHSATVTPNGGNALGGTLTAVVSNAATGDGNGVVTWNYGVANSATQHLGVGDTAIEIFTVTITDSTGKTDTQTITVTVTGTNDAPVLTVDTSGGVTEDGADPTLSDTGTLSFTDVDVNDGHTVSAAYNGDALWTGGGLTAGQVTALTSGFSADSDSWDYSVANSALQFLGAGESITLSFDVTVTDDSGAGNNADTETVTLTLTGSNDAPLVTGAVLATVDEDDSDPATVQLLANASDPDRTDDVDTASVSYAVSDGTWVPAVVYSVDHETGALTFDPNQFNALGVSESIELTFTYNVVDGNGGVTPTTAVVTITGSNDAPLVTGAVLATVDEDDSDPATVQLLANASDPDRTDDVDTASVSYAVSDGTWVPAVVYSVDHETGALTFDPNQFNALGVSESIELTFTYNVVDGNGGVTPTTAVVTITGSNDAPLVTGAVLATVDEDDSDPATVQLLANASDPDRTDDVDTASVSYAVSDGTWVPAVVYSVDHETGALTFDPNQFNALGVSESIELTFTYNVVDGNGGVTPTTAVVTITGSNDAPLVTGAVLATVDEDDSDPATVQLLANASDPDRTDDVDTASVSYAVSDGTWVPAVVYSVDHETGALTFDPNQFNALGVSESIELTFTYNVVDGNGGVTPTTAVVTITGSNDAPLVTGAVLATVDEDDSDPATVQLLANASDPDRTDDVDTASVSYAVSDGTWVPAVVYSVDHETGALTFDPNQFNALGVSESIELTFTYNVVDGNGGVTPTTAVVTITGSNDAPLVTGAVLATVDEDDSDPATVQLLANASDPDRTDDVDTASVSYAVSDGTWVPAVVYSVDHETGALTFDPNQFNALGVSESIELTFTYNVVDGNGGVTPTTAVVTITGSNDAPLVTGAVLATVDEDDSDPATVQLLANASDPDRTDDVDTASVSYAVSDGTWVPAVVYSVDHETGALTFDPNQFNALGVSESIELTFTYNVVDGNGGVTPTTAVVTITGSNDAPAINAAVTPVLAAVAEDAGVPVGAIGTLVSALVNLNPPAGGLDNVADADNGALTGIAITDTNDSNGTWWFSTNNGGSWTQVGSVSDASALLLAADANTRVYFQADSNFNGTVSDGVTFRAWDRTSGTAGTLANTTTNGGSTAFSSATDTASIVVTGVNDNPVVVTDRIIVSNSTTGITIPVSALLNNDTDVDGLAVTITSVGSASGITGLTLNANGTISFNSLAATGNGVASFQYIASDGAGGSSTVTVTIDVIAVAAGNTADTVNLSGSGNYQASYIDGRNGGDNLTGGSPGDIFLGASGNDSLLGGSGNDLLIGGDNNDTLNGGAGNDVLRGGQNNDDIDGGAGNEDLIDYSDAAGAAGINFTLTQSGSNTTFNTPGSTLLGNDTYRNIEGVIGTNFVDTLTGSSSNDVLRGGAGNDTLNGAGGNGDLIDFSDGNAGLTFTLTNNGVGTLFNASVAGLGTDTYSGFEGVIGTAFADTLTGSAGADQLRGGGGNDVISGSAGDDRIVGAAGADTLTGGADNDTFVFDSAPNAVDSIADFDASETAASEDSIELSLAIFSGLTTSAGSTLSASEFASTDGGGAGDVVGAGIRVIYDSATGNLYYDPDGGSSGNRTLVADITLTNPSDTFDFNDIRVGT